MKDTKLALLGGTPAIQGKPSNDLIRRWPIFTKEDEDAAVDVIRNHSISGHDITDQFEAEFAAWQGTKYAIGFCNGTQALAAAMFSIGLGAGDEIICPTVTYWASATQSLLFGAKPVFCNINEKLSIDPDDLERRITTRTKAVMIVHYAAYPCDMDRIMDIVRRHNIYLIEDVSHAQGGMYKGKKLGTFGHVSAMSLMSEKSFGVGEMGMLVTDDRKIYEHAMAYGHYDRNTPDYIKESDDLKDFMYLPLGGVKGRVNQICSAIGRVQLKYYDQRCEEIRKAMNYFWDLLEGVPGIRALRTDEREGSTMGGWYAPKGLYVAEELEGLPLKLFCDAVVAEGAPCRPGANFCLHTHPLFSKYDFRHAGKPSSIEYSDDIVYNGGENLEASMAPACFSVPWFKHFDKEWIEMYASAYRKVAENYKQLKDVEIAADGPIGRWKGY